VKNAIRSILKDNGIVHLCVIQKFPSFIILGTDLTDTEECYWKHVSEMIFEFEGTTL